MSLRHPMRRLSVEQRLERAASVANLAMLRTYSKPSHIQIESINWLTFLLESELRSIPLDDTLTRKKILNQLAINRSILAPIRRLPVELLSEIFFHVQKLYPLRTLQAATTISHVCSTWRNLARGHAALWTKVVVETMGDFDDYCKRFLPMTRQAPLELRCDDREILRDLWDRVVPYASRWRRITVVGHLSKLPDLHVLYMENLERLAVDAYGDPMYTDVSALDFVVAPKLRHVGLTLDALQSERQLHIPVARALTSLDIDVMTPFPVTYTLPLLRACAQTLQSLALKVRFPRDGPEGSYPTSASDNFVMDALSNLRLVDPACALLNHINAPCIHELILSNVPAYGSRSLLGFLTRSQASRSLKMLRVYKPEERDVPPWIACLELMDKLTDLHFDAMLSNREFLERLVRHANQPPILPSLRNIAMFHIFSEHQELHDILRTMMKSRSRKTLYRGRPALVILGWIRD